MSRILSPAAALLVLLPGCAAPRTAPAPAPSDGGGGAPAAPAAAATAAVPARPVPHPVVAPEAFQRAVEAGTRTAAGVPGPRYWTQWADYRLSARLDTQGKRLTGSGRITYHNRSPDTLSVVYLHLYHNYSAPGAVRNDPAEDPAGGVTLTRLAAQGQTLREGEGYRVDGTTLAVRLPRPLAPGDTLPIEAEWWFPIAQNLAQRAGWSRDNLFFLAYWYPQMAVYDDVAGWHTDPHLGQGEFYAGFARYDVTLDAPEGWVVTATGELRNEEEVLPPAVVERLRRARESDSVVHVLTAADFGPGRATRDVPGDRLRWRFRADSVRDFAFGATRESLWDALRAPAGDRDGDGRPEHTLAQALYRAPATRIYWVNAARFVREGLEFGARFNGYPYPWPHMTAIEADDLIYGGMEYPMLAIVRAFADMPNDERQYGETVHEVLHSWVPMLVSTDETRYGWLDEGITGFAEANATAPRFARPQRVADQNRYLEVARSGAEGEIMRWTDFHHSLTAFSVATYQKPSSVLFALRTLLGEEAFRRGWQGFIRSWAYRQPTPWDFFNAMEAAAGRDLDWFWSAWYHTTWTLDHAVAVTQQGPETVVEVRDLGAVPMPGRLRITRESGETIEREVPVETWLGGARTAVVRVPAGSPVVRVEVDPTGTFPDIDRRNNVWTRE